MIRRAIVVAAASTALSACGGGSSHGGTIPPLAVHHTATANFTLTVPKRIPVSAGVRRVQYVSASTQSVLFTVSPGALQTKINLTPQNCTTNPNDTADICTLAVTAPIGNDTFAMVAYDQPFNAMGNLPGNAHALSAASNFSATIAEGTANVTIPLISGGIPSTLTIALTGGATSPTIVGGGASTQPVTVTVYDADGNIIVAPGAFVDASGNANPIIVTSANGSTTFGYAVTPASTGVTGPTGATIALTEPDDTVALAYNGSGYVPATDTLTHTALPNHVGGATTTAFDFGWHFTPPFAPALLLPQTAAIAAASGHQGIVIADRTAELGFVGDVMTSCAVPPVNTGTVSRIGGITFDPGITDQHVYVWANDSSLGNGTALDSIALSSLTGGSCALAGHDAGAFSGTTDGTAAAHGQLFAITTSSSDFIESVNVPAMTGVYANVINGGADFGTESVGVSPNGSNDFVQFGAKKRIDEIPFGSASPSNTQNLAGMLDGYPAGMTVDTIGHVYVNDTTSTTFGANGGIDVFSSSALLGSAQLQAPLPTAGASGALQNIAVGPYHGGTAIYAATTNGLEIFALPITTGNVAPTQTLALPATPIAIVSGNDAREWILLSDGTLDVLPPQ